MQVAVIVAVVVIITQEVNTSSSMHREAYMGVVRTGYANDAWV